MKYEIKGDKIVAETGDEFDHMQVQIGSHTLTAYNDWFGRDVLPLWERHGLVDRLRGNVMRYLEIGVNCGVSFAWVMEHLLRKDGEAIGVDGYTHSRGRVHAGLRVARDLCHKNLAPWTGNFRLIEEPSQLALSRSLNAFFDSVHRGIEPVKYDFDLVYVDGDHYAPRALFDMCAAFELMADGGVIIIDDYDRQFSHGAKQVRPAVNAFFDCWSNVLEPLFIVQKQAAFIKRTSRGDRRKKRRQK